MRDQVIDGRASIMVETIEAAVEQFVDGIGGVVGKCGECQHFKPSPSSPYADRRVCSKIVDEMYSGHEAEMYLDVVKDLPESVGEDFDYSKFFVAVFCPSEDFGCVLFEQSTPTATSGEGG